MCTMFFWTIWVGEDRMVSVGGVQMHAAFAGLFLHAIMAFLTSLILPQLNAQFGTLAVYLFFEGFYGIALILLNKSYTVKPSKSRFLVL